MLQNCSLHVRNLTWSGIEQYFFLDFSNEVSVDPDNGMGNGMDLGMGKPPSSSSFEGNTFNIQSYPSLQHIGDYQELMPDRLERN